MSPASFIALIKNTRAQVSTRDLHALALLHSEGPQYLSVLTKALDITHSSITAMADKLEAAGLAERVRGRSDRRSIHLTITPAGSALVESILTAA